MHRCNSSHRIFIPRQELHANIGRENNVGGFKHVTAPTMPDRYWPKDGSSQYVGCKAANGDSHSRFFVVNVCTGVVNDISKRNVFTQFVCDSSARKFGHGRLRPGPHC